MGVSEIFPDQADFTASTHWFSKVGRQTSGQDMMNSHCAKAAMHIQRHMMWLPTSKSRQALACGELSQVSTCWGRKGDVPSVKIAALDQWWLNKTKGPPCGEDNAKPKESPSSTLDLVQFPCSFGQLRLPVSEGSAADVKTLRSFVKTL